jgi:hypothetical protein
MGMSRGGGQLPLGDSVAGSPKEPATEPRLLRI